MRYCERCGKKNRHGKGASKDMCIDCNTGVNGQWFRWAKNQFCYVRLTGKKKDRRKQNPWLAFAHMRAIMLLRRVKQLPVLKQQKDMSTEWNQWVIESSRKKHRPKENKWKTKAKNMSDALAHREQEHAKY